MQSNKFQIVVLNSINKQPSVGSMRLVNNLHRQQRALFILDNLLKNNHLLDLHKRTMLVYLGV